MDIFSNIIIENRERLEHPYAFREKDGQTSFFETGNEMRNAIIERGITQGKALVRADMVQKYYGYGQEVAFSPTLFHGRFKYKLTGKTNLSLIEFGEMFDGWGKDLILFNTWGSHYAMFTNNTVHLFKAELVLEDVKKVTCITFADL